MALGRSRYAPAAVFASLLIDKGVVLIPAGFIPSPAGAMTPYIPTAVELGIVLAIWSVGALLVTVLFRIAIAAREAEAGGRAARPELTFPRRITMDKV
jgi:molybdopterin-containing oxidoreductase family membrane subunit